LSVPLLKRIALKKGETTPLILNERDCGWLAGLIDGEGCLCLTKQSGGHTRAGYSMIPNLQISNNSSPSLQRVRETIGAGSIHRQRNAFYYMLWSSQRLFELLIQIEPILIVKRKQAELLLEAYTLNQKHYAGHTPHKERLLELYQIMRSLNAKGKKVH
jgi:hypothetical protein